MTIRVTKRDIKMGKRSDGCWCPVALAIRRVALTTNIGVGVVEYFVGDNKPKPLPAEVINFIIAFDEGKPVHPFTFNL